MVDRCGTKVTAASFRRPSWGLCCWGRLYETRVSLEQRWLSDMLHEHNIIRTREPITMSSEMITGGLQTEVWVKQQVLGSVVLLNFK